MGHPDVDGIELVTIPKEAAVCRMCLRPATRAVYELGGPSKYPYKAWRMYCDTHGKHIGHGIIPSEEYRIKNADVAE